jgi:hypothetical protein
VFFRLDGYFVQELHAHSSEFIARWMHERLTLDAAVAAFLSSCDKPYTLLYLLVQKAMTERMREGAFDVQDSVFVCNLCSHLALDAGGLPDDAPHLRWFEIGGERIRFRHRDVGEAFLQLLSACIDQLGQPGSAVSGYFRLMDATLTKLGWPTFEPLTERVLCKSLEPMEKAFASADSGTYGDYLSRKVMDSRTAFGWLVHCYNRRDVAGFVRAPLHLVADGRVSGPVLSGPYSYASMTGTRRPSEEQMRGLIVAFLTRKLWYGTDITCQEIRGGPHGGSVIGCSRWPECERATIGLGGASYCADAIWLKCLSLYAGLSRRV